MSLNGILESLENLVEKKQQVLCLVTIYNEEWVFSNDSVHFSAR